MENDWCDTVAWPDSGLLPAIAQDIETGDVLMLAWMTPEALKTTVNEGRAVYWSRSRGNLWRKGEESGHVQWIREIRLDCDSDTILLRVEQQGGIACHTGRKTCFFRKLDEGQWLEVEPMLKSPESIYGK